ncbi:MAG: GyrI-like domain-containing protein [Anaerolineae bacterium]|jgi:DNA gyrase inhibitor GyrI
MSKLEVRIVRLDPLRVASAYGFGPSPEGIAWDKLLGWVRSKGLDLSQHRFFGFNNPDPSPGSPNYGYEQWITVGPEVEAEGEIRVQAFHGGLYAVTRCESLETIGQAWKQLFQWRETSKYKFAHHQLLEECLSDPEGPESELVLDLYLPIAE